MSDHQEFRKKLWKECWNKSIEYNAGFDLSVERADKLLERFDQAFPVNDSDKDDSVVKGFSSNKTGE